MGVLGMHTPFIPVRGGHITELDASPLAGTPVERLVVDKRGWIIGVRRIEWPLKARSFQDAIFGDRAKKQTDLGSTTKM